MTKQTRVAIYARVSTDDKRQTTENQLRELRQWCENAGYKIVAEYTEHESGRKGTDQRKQFAALFADASKRKFDLVLVWALDRFSREGMAATVQYLQRLANCGVAFHSFTEPHLATDNELTRDILLAVMSSLAKAEAVKLSARVRAGIARAKAQGIHCGRPKCDPEAIAKARQRLAEGASIRKAAAEAGLSFGTVQGLARTN